ESLRRRRKELDEKEEQLKESLFKFNKFLKVCARLAVATPSKRPSGAEQGHHSMLISAGVGFGKGAKLYTENHVLRLFSIYPSPLSQFGEIWELVARFDTLLATREQLLGRESEGRQLGEALRQQHRRFVDEQSDRILRYNNQLSELQTRLEQVRSLALKWEATWNHIQSISARETLLLGQIKVTTLNLFHMMGGQTDDENGVGIGDTLGQLDRVMPSQLTYGIGRYTPIMSHEKH
uniref:DUF4200 domain-containing protein n=1 Tax=Scleropages formosus TaxID=113540 RepID=A0A8C9WM49_SCLFO